jgi:hypothetical protein
MQANIYPHYLIAEFEGQSNYKNIEKAFPPIRSLFDMVLEVF